MDALFASWASDPCQERRDKLTAMLAPTPPVEVTPVGLTDEELAAAADERLRAHERQWNEWGAGAEYQASVAHLRELEPPLED